MNVQWKSVWKNIKKLITNNFWLKILALLCASLLWLLVVNIDDPTQSRNFTAVFSKSDGTRILEHIKIHKQKKSV